MIKIENPLGTVSITSEYFAGLVGRAASRCFGVSEMVVSDPVQGIKYFATRGNVPDKGVSVSIVNGALVIDLHIAVSYGVNITVIVQSIVSEVKYAVEDATSLKVAKVNVFVDAMTQSKM